MNHELSRRSLLRFAAGTTAAVGMAGFAGTAAAAPTGLRVLTINTWMNGTKVPDGLNRVAAVIRQVDADIVLLSEAKTATADLVPLLAAAGATYHRATSSDPGVLSKFPIASAGTLPGMAKAVIPLGDKTLVAYAAHLEYRWYATYLPRGYGAGVPSGEFSEFGWNKIPGGPVTDVAAVQRCNDASGRPGVIDRFLADAEAERARGRMVLLGGDFNEPSALDWTTGTKDLYDHNGTVVPWGSTAKLAAAGYVDAYRSTFPDPATHPGFTWPASNADAPVSSLTWAPDADERDRIDYLFSSPGSGLRVTGAGIVGPRASIVRSKRVDEPEAGEFTANPTPWPTDHKAVLATYAVG
ncbi:Endonuclease/exonuclease/phosphatase OS=Tsukamurella paurometabola (strain ATCC 8368 / DSM /CCUG 35730 / CIP 100753 / JCM 10117 / KCTC 9821 / NBRC 16120/ NCIMB 702349 / NCTC 13040) OX=521096 GN=Tpau_0895 PE=4 SV=1 [Tsukamurella paurometabola]|uniref:Endonuclease/exonuclease/phosphatase n=1 Tax=Tsukamurella paurometabola (strain ATCC 8368 / DSM 20162 / CCUG 35730 / CIP 100753 / JCM 10117 / KCTC 9821 / NBRC 16120 / NCIMB 702349 / NCTC 13040) TaxID=521096 RepID=D5UUF8_TSUPD|nr:endonuclease/exonuclease/phosphatase family protein [Tsukamurella paurometabola]ADG77529.1 Endonuclease/exonuclease/phosphatase [Tsukamurella paurometabola DSM 20162]SUP27588.1 Uncharacterized protein conserved in bacteria [Tsukamurella paurometabola]